MTKHNSLVRVSRRAVLALQSQCRGVEPSALKSLPCSTLAQLFSAADCDAAALTQLNDANSRCYTTTSQQSTAADSQSHALINPPANHAHSFTV